MNKNIIKNILKGILAIFIYFFLSYFKYIPFLLFNINYDNLSFTIKQIYLLMYEFSTIFIIVYIFKKEFIHNLKYFFKNKKELLNNYIKYWFMMLGLMMISNIFIFSFTTTEISNNQTTILELLKQAPLYTFIISVITAPILEEMVFRFSIRKIFTNDKLFIIISGLFFGFMHIISSLDSLVNILFIIPYSIPGFIFAYVYTKSKNIFVPISLHLIHNLVMMVLQIIILF